MQINVRIGQNNIGKKYRPEMRKIENQTNSGNEYRISCQKLMGYITHIHMITKPTENTVAVIILYTIGRVYGALIFQYAS